ncbi:MAG TPA: hypothetical protein VHG93_19325 [Longimicrobium sp.]|nr:hypothetical protein [Longimicrobium sp.]
MLRPALATALVLLSVNGIDAQTAAPAPVRAVLVPQVGATVNWSVGARESGMAALLAEIPVHPAWSATTEVTAALGEFAHGACRLVSEDECVLPVSLRTGVAAGFVAHPVRLGPLAPYAGASAGFAGWKGDYDSGIAPMASLRAGLDLQVFGPLGARAELVRRIAWSTTPDAWPLHADVFSVGARMAIRR